MGIKENMIEQNISNSEYDTFYEKLSNLRLRIANDLPIKLGLHILDVGTGYGYFAILTPFFEEVWAQFGHNIEENGLVHYSKVILMITQKVRET